jgi:ribonuclease R
MEGLATSAERDSIKYMQVKYMQDHKDQEFLGVISVLLNGEFLSKLSKINVKVCRIRDIKDDYYTFDSEQYALVGATSKIMH